MHLSRKRNNMAKIGLKYFSYLCNKSKGQTEQQGNGVDNKLNKKKEIVFFSKQKLFAH